MSLRLRFFQNLPGSISALAWILFLAGKVFALEITYAPGVVFSGEPLAFRLQSTVTAGALVRTNGVETARFPLRERVPSEFTFRPDRELILSFSQGTHELNFQIIRPQSIAPLRERDGYLETDGVPAVLLPDHRKAPPLDRRWETLDLLSRRVRDTRPSLEKLLWIRSGTPQADTSLAAELSSGPPTVLPVSVRDAWFYVHGVLTRPEIPSTRFLVLEIDEQDLERGMPPHEWFMKWQFALQYLESTSGYEDGLLLGPPESPVSAPWLPLLREELQALARAHNLHYIDRSRPEALWTERLLNRLSRDYVLP